MMKKTFTTITVEKPRGNQALQALTLILLALCWAGQIYTLFAGGSTDIKGHSLIVILSLVNADVLFTGKQAMNQRLNILAKCEGVLVVAWALYEVIRLLLK